MMRKMNESLQDVLNFMNDMEDDAIIKIHDKFSGEIYEGSVIEVYQNVISLNESFENKCKFEILF